MEILHEEIYNWLILDIIIGIALMLLFCFLSTQVIKKEDKVKRWIAYSIMVIFFSLITIFQSHDEKVIIVKVEDWNEYHEFMNTDEWNVKEDNGNILKLNKYY